MSQRDYKQGKLLGQGTHAVVYEGTHKPVRPRPARLQRAPPPRREPCRIRGPLLHASCGQTAASLLACSRGRSRAAAGAGSPGSWQLRCLAVCALVQTGDTVALKMVRSADSATATSNADERSMVRRRGAAAGAGRVAWGGDQGMQQAHAHQHAAGTTRHTRAAGRPGDLGDHWGEGQGTGSAPRQLLRGLLSSSRAGGRRHVACAPLWRFAACRGTLHDTLGSWAPAAMRLCTCACAFGSLAFVLRDI